jgi:hypothetical protein
METPDLDALEQTLRAPGAAFVPPGIVDMPDDATSSGEASCQHIPEADAGCAIRSGPRTC